MGINRNNVMISLLNSMKIEISDSGYAQCDRTWNQSEVHSPYSRLYYIKDGEGMLFFNGQEIVMKPDMLYFVPLGNHFAYRCDNRLEKLYFHINIPMNETYDLFSGCHEIIAIPAEHVAKLILQYQSYNVLESIYLNARLHEDVIKIFEAAKLENVNITSYSETVRKAVAYINTNLSVKLTVKEIAEQIFVSESKLTKEFRHDLGMSIGTYIDHKIIFEAEKLLADCNYPMIDISEKFGFCDRFYFSRRFKEKTGQTPRQYRQKLAKIYNG